MARCDVGSAQPAGVSCRLFYRLQAQVADQTGRIRQDLRSLQAAVSGRGELSHQDKLTAARLDKYMGKGTSHDHNKIALVYNVLDNAERQLRTGAELTKFDKVLRSGGNTQATYMVLGSVFDENTILHEAVHYGTSYLRIGRVGSLPAIRDGGTLPGTMDSYGSLQASLERARSGWENTSKAAASFSWVVTGP